jgi:hypothetical protein
MRFDALSSNDMSWYNFSRGLARSVDHGSEHENGKVNIFGHTSDADVEPGLRNGIENEISALAVRRGTKIK